MHATIFTFLSLCAAVSHATAICKPFLDTFEDTDANPIVPQANKIGLYHGLTYQGLDVAPKNPLTGTVGGIVPESGDNTAGFTMLTDILNIGTITLHPFGSIEKSAEVSSFDLTSFYFGISVDSHTTAGSVAQAGKITIVGYTKDGAQGPVYSASFYPKDLLSNRMQLVELPNTFKQLSRVVFGIEEAALSQSQASIFLDDIYHCNNA